MVALTNAFAFKNVFGAMKLQLVGTKTVTSVSVSGRNFEPLAGMFRLQQSRLLWMRLSRCRSLMYSTIQMTTVEGSTLSLYTPAVGNLGEGNDKDNYVHVVVETTDGTLSPVNTSDVVEVTGYVAKADEK